MPDIPANGDPNSAAFLVRRPAGGDYVRAGSQASLAGAATVLRSTYVVPNELTASLFLSQPVGYDTIQVWWGVPPEGLVNWSHMCVVRSGFGHPSTPSDGQIVDIFQRPTVGYSDTIVPGTFFDRGLPAGRWYYYTLFFRIGFKWIVANTTEALVPVDYHHRDHLLDLVPPFYLTREAEDSTSFLSRWMTMIGYDLDYTRTLAEGIQQTYDPDSAPQPLLDAMGQQNLGFAKPSKLGDIRYRSVLANNRTILFERGTINGLQTYVESVFKSTTTVTNGLNELLLIDDAEFVKGVGDWSPMPWRIGYQLAIGRYGTNTANTPPIPLDAFRSRKVKIEAFVQYTEHTYQSPGDPPVLGPPTGPTSVWPLPTAVSSARGIARIQAFNGEQLAITCGAGQQSVVVGVDSSGQSLTYDEQHLDAFYRGIPVEVPTDPADPLPTYYLSFWSRRQPGNFAEVDLIVFGFMQFDSAPPTQGFSDGFRGVGGANPAVLTNPLDTSDGNRGGFDGWQSRSSGTITASEGPGGPIVTPNTSGLLETVRIGTGGPGTTADQWEHLVASFQITAGCRYLVPFIWYKQAGVDANGVPTPVTTPRYITGVMVNQSQGGGGAQAFTADQYLKMINEATPSQHLIGAVGFDQPSGTRTDYKIIGEP